MRRAAIVCAAAAALFASQPAAAQDWGALRDALLEMLGDVLLMEGYVYSGFAHEGALAEGESEDVPIRLGPGLDFAIVGECELDCSDLDLELYDAAGNVIASDFMLDEFPFIEATLPGNGSYRLRVSMAGCRASSCRYALQPLARAPGRPV
jgi:hypothetical protein